MNNEKHESVQDREKSLQRAFDEAAGELGLHLEPAGGLTRTVGVAAVCIPIAEHDLVNDGLPTHPQDDQEIETLILGLESLPWDQMQQRWREFAADPHLSVTSEGLVMIDQAIVDKWMSSPQFQEILREFPPFSPRQVEVSQLQIVHVGGSRAGATYRVVEHFTNGKVLAGNMTVILGKLKQIGWRILVMTKGGRSEPRGNA
ncbi:MAG TPA: hypothetical protein VE685_27315 [Thermoanaerobaculia bacterium]|nr:hypothetical protein [Thermoanaerobaculia bacterium]